ncbi:hypothetical protein JW766_02050 [Candidatus Dojkabacteria bacterium]|nr:hypothetical protein [Candidatus Dojkabacteria bacterium]
MTLLTGEQSRVGHQERPSQGGEVRPDLMQQYLDQEAARLMVPITSALTIRDEIRANFRMNGAIVAEPNGQQRLIEAQVTWFMWQVSRLRVMASPDYQRVVTGQALGEQIVHNEYTDDGQLTRTERIPLREVQGSLAQKAQAKLAYAVAACIEGATSILQPAAEAFGKARESVQGKVMEARTQAGERRQEKATVRYLQDQVREAERLIAEQLSSALTNEEAQALAVHSQERLETFALLQERLAEILGGELMRPLNAAVLGLNDDEIAHLHSESKTQRMAIGAIYEIFYGFAQIAAENRDVVHNIAVALTQHWLVSVNTEYSLLCAEVSPDEGIRTASLERMAELEILASEVLVVQQQVAFERLLETTDLPAEQRQQLIEAMTTLTSQFEEFSIAFIQGVGSTLGSLPNFAAHLQGSPNSRMTAILMPQATGVGVDPTVIFHSLGPERIGGIITNSDWLKALRDRFPIGSPRYNFYNSAYRTLKPPIRAVSDAMTRLSFVTVGEATMNMAVGAISGLLISLALMRFETPFVPLHPSPLVNILECMFFGVASKLLITSWKIGKPGSLFPNAKIIPDALRVLFGQPVGTRKKCGAKRGPGQSYAYYESGVWARNEILAVMLRHDFDTLPPAIRANLFAIPKRIGDEDTVVIAVQYTPTGNIVPIQRTDAYYWSPTTALTDVRRSTNPTTEGVISRLTGDVMGQFNREVNRGTDLRATILGRTVDLYAYNRVKENEILLSGKMAQRPTPDQKRLGAIEQGDGFMLYKWAPAIYAAAPALLYSALSVFQGQGRDLSLSIPLLGLGAAALQVGLNVSKTYSNSMPRTHYVVSGGDLGGGRWVGALPGAQGEDLENHGYQLGIGPIEWGIRHIGDLVDLDNAIVGVGATALFYLLQPGLPPVAKEILRGISLYHIGPLSLVLGYMIHRMINYFGPVNFGFDDPLATPTPETVTAPGGGSTLDGVWRTIRSGGPLMDAVQGAINTTGVTDITADIGEHYFVPNADPGSAYFCDTQIQPPTLDDCVQIVKDW